MNTMNPHVVPWVNRKEWLSVKNDFCSNDLDRMWKAVRRMAIWDCRVPRLPKAIEGTLRLTYVYCKDRSKAEDVDDDRSDVLLMYSAVLIRFLNFTLDVTEKTSRTMYEQAATVNIPDWIVQLRHDISHGEGLPSLSLLRMAVEYLLQWLKETYWIPENKLYESDLKFDKYENVIGVYNLWIYLNEKISVGVITVSDIINDVDTNSVHLLKRLRNKYWNDTKFKDILLSELDDVLMRIMHNYLMKSCWRRLIDYTLSDERSIFLSENLTSEIIGDIRSDEMKELWPKFVRLLVETRHVIYLLRRLVEIGNNRYSSTKQLLASIWTKNLVDALRTMQKVVKNKSSTEKEISKKKRKRSNNRENNDNRLDLTDFTDDLKDILRCALLQPHRYTSLFIEGLFSIQVISLEEKKEKMLLNLLNIFLNQEDHNGDSFEQYPIYTVHTLLGEEPSKSENNKGRENEDQRLSMSSWKKCSDREIWSQYPLGLLPNKYDEVNNFTCSPVPNKTKNS